MEMFLAPLPILYIFLSICFARVCSNNDDFNSRNLFLTAKLLKQGYRYHKIRKEFSKFYHRHSDLSTALAKHHANGDTSMVTEIVNLCPIM